MNTPAPVRSTRARRGAATVAAALTVTAGVLVSGATADAAVTAERSSGTSARDADRTVYRPGLAVRRESNVSTRLAALPVDYRRAVRGWLEDAYRDAGSDEACANSPKLTVHAYHRDGFAASTQGVFPATGEPERCAQGGYSSIWSKRGGAWREVVAGQEPPTCRQLSFHRVPRSMVESCFDDRGNPVAY